MRPSKKIIAVALAVVGVLTIFTGCAGREVPTEEDSKLQVVCTIFPEYDWAREIIGESDAIDLTLIMDGGVDMHSYQATAEDIVQISNCDMLVYVGGESDAWVVDSVREAVNKDMTVVNLMEVLSDSVKTEEHIEGMQGEAEKEPESDEHVWLSLKNAETICAYLARSMGELDPGNKDAYAENADSYIQQLRELDDAAAQAAESGSVDTLLFADRFPFRYFVDDYGLNYYAAFPGCSADSEADFDTVIFLADKIDELGLDYVITIDGSDSAIAESILSVTKKSGVDILEMDSLQSVTNEEINSGKTYISAMEDNLDVLKTALG